MVRCTGGPQLDQEKQSNRRECVRNDQRQYDLHDDGGTDGRQVEAAPAHQAYAHDAAADACDREQTIDGFAHARDPEHVADSRAPDGVVGPKQVQPADRV